MLRNVVITGVGIISALGKGVEKNITALREGKTGIGPIKYLNTRLSDQFVLGEVKYSNGELKSMLGIDSDKILSRTSLLACLAGKEAIEMAGLNNDDLRDCALISGTTVGGMDLSEQVKDFETEESVLEILSQHSCGESTERMADYLKIEGFQNTYSTACSSAANAIMLGARMIKAGRADRVIAGGTDALACFTLNGFNSLMILDGEHCRPFDKSRAGLNLGEGAGYIVLEAEEVAKPNTILASLTGYANANDAHHQTASSPEGIGAQLSMKKAMEVSGISADDITYINAHGTGTPNNDSSEAMAISILFEGNMPAFSSTKAFTGHTLGACGGIEAVFSVMSLYNQEIYSGLNFKISDEDVFIQPVMKYYKGEVNHVLSNSFGFGGNNSSLIFSKK